MQKIIDELENIKLRTWGYIQPVSPEMLVCYLSGLQNGIVLSSELLTFHDCVEAFKKSTVFRGWDSRASHPFHEMREKGVPEDEIISEILELELQKWKLLEEDKKL